MGILSSGLAVFLAAWKLVSQLYRQPPHCSMPLKQTLGQAAVKAAAEAEAEATASMARQASNLEASSKHSRSMEVDDSSTPPPNHNLRRTGAW